MKSPWIGLLDCNNFFVSCERLFRPDLNNKPVVVLSSNDGCVVARSNEIKDIGIPMGVPYFHIKDKLSEVGATVFSSHLALYRDISRRVFSEMSEYLGSVEQYSIDEAFFQITEDPKDIALHLKNLIEKNVGIPVSVGVAKTKTQAKYASSLAKKETGTYVLDEDRWNLQIKDIPLAKIWGVGGESELKFKKYGITTVADLVTADNSRLSNIFGINGLRLQQELLGNPIFRVGKAREPQKSILSSRSFKKTTTEKSVLADAIAYHVKQTTEDLRRMNTRTSSISLSIKPDRYGDFLLRGGTKEVVLTNPTSSTLKLLNVAKELLDDLFEEGVPYKKVGITLSHFTPKEYVQNDLFNSPEINNDEVLMSVIDRLNKGKNRNLIRVGTRLKETMWQPKLDSRSPSYTTSWNDISIVKSRGSNGH